MHRIQQNERRRRTNNFFHGVIRAYKTKCAMSHTNYDTLTMSHIAMVQLASYQGHQDGALFLMSGGTFVSSPSPPEAIFVLKLHQTIGVEYSLHIADP